MLLYGHRDQFNVALWPQRSVQCCFMSTETVRTIRDEEPWTDALTFSFTQLLSSEDAHDLTLAFYTMPSQLKHS